MKNKYTSYAANTLINTLQKYVEKNGHYVDQYAIS